jgi:peptidoglycan/xylan/chitin deacetylase (PgdA/CDA1 family)
MKGERHDLSDFLPLVENEMMYVSNLLLRIAGKYHRTLAYRFYRRMALIQTSAPIISFTFDDAPRSAFTTGGDILKAHGARATFYVSLGLLGCQTEVGTIASSEDLLRAVKEGDELGCHTFDHLDPWQTPAQKFIESVVENKRALDSILPGINFRTFSYPKSEPKPFIKLQLEKYFMCCRGGGQTLNAGVTDLNLLKAYFLDKRNKVDMNSIKRLIDHNTSCRGWLIFATHDVTGNPSRYGCTPEFFEKVVECAARSGALLLPVDKACESLLASNCERTGNSK